MLAGVHQAAQRPLEGGGGFGGLDDDDDDDDDDGLYLFLKLFEHNC